MPGVLEDANQKIVRLHEEMKQLEREQQSGQADHTERLDEVQERLREAERQQKQLEEHWQAERRLVERIRVVEDRLEQGIGDESSRAALNADRESLAALQKNGAMVPLVADAGVVSAVVAEWTGIPLGQMHQDEISAVLDLDKRLAQKVIGQQLAVDTITRRIRTARAGLDDPGRPLGVFFLAGPSGVGKTEMGHAVADVLFGSERSLVVINMSEYQEAHTISQLKGAPPGYVGHGQGGILTEAVRRHPFSVVLLDEIEKAHPDVLELFFQVFDKGTLEDGEGVVVDFRHTVILMASNLGGDEIEAICAEGRADDALMLETVTRVLDNHFPAALLGRVVVIPFGPLSHQDLCQIAELKLIQVRNRFNEAHHANLTWTPEAVDELASNCVDSRTGARQLDRLLGHDLLPSLSGLVLERMVEGEEIGDVNLDRIDEGRLSLKFVTGGGEAILSLMPSSFAKRATQTQSFSSPFARALQAEEAHQKELHAGKAKFDTRDQTVDAPKENVDTPDTPEVLPQEKSPAPQTKSKAPKEKSKPVEKTIDVTETTSGEASQTVNAPDVKSDATEQAVVVSQEETLEEPAPILKTQPFDVRNIDAKIAEILATHEISLDAISPAVASAKAQESVVTEDEETDDDDLDDESAESTEAPSEEETEGKGVFGRFLKLFH